MAAVFPSADKLIVGRESVLEITNGSVYLRPTSRSRTRDALRRLREEVTLSAHDYDADGVWFVLTGRGAVVSSYDIWSIRAEILRRMTPDERAALEALPYESPETVVARQRSDVEGFAGTAVIDDA